MNERVIDISSAGGFVSVSNGLLTLNIEGHQKLTVPPEDVAAVVAGHYAVTFTREAVAKLAETGGQLIVCDRKAMPVAMFMPLVGFHQPAARMLAQARVKGPVLKRVWRQVVRNKIRSQAAVLRKLGKSDAGFEQLAAEVKSGDTSNVEGQAARVYWVRLFGDDFRRDIEAEDQNRFLNYGYALVRAMMCRAICGAGLHPGLGVHHHHRANAYCLADDLMEPFRPVVDEVVAGVMGEVGANAFMTPEIKKKLLEVVRRRVRVGEDERVMFDAMTRCALSLGGVFEGRRKQIELPDWS